MAKEYIIVSGLSSDVEDEVQHNLAEGWELCGGVSQHDGRFAQAMVFKPQPALDPDETVRGMVR